MKATFKALGLRWSKHRDRGATAVVIGLTMVILMGAAAVSFDTANLALQRQSLRNLVDAAAQAGAGYLPDATLAINEAKKYATKYDSSFTPDVTAWCMVTSTGATKQVASGQFPGTCDPNPSGSHVYVNGSGGVKCDEFLCAIPCTVTGAQCNALQVAGKKNVPFYFAPAIGIPTGSTGSVSSVSCTNLCNGGGTINPLDVAFVADRTPSMSNADFSSMQAGIYNTLKYMTPELQFVTLGTIHGSRPTAACPTTLGPAIATGGTGYYPDGGARGSTWMPLSFSNDYLTGTMTSTTRTQNATSALVKGVNCMDHSTASSSYPWGTHLAAPLKAAARMLLGKTTSNLGTLSLTRSSLIPAGTKVKQWIIFETDGMPEETIGWNSKPYKDSSTLASSTDLDNALEPTSKNNPTNGCANFADVADRAKKAGLNIIMIAYGSATTKMCGTKAVKDVMAAAASPTASGPSTAPSTCAAANTDNDYYFCATTGTELAAIFTTALKAATSGTTKFVKMPV